MKKEIRVLSLALSFVMMLSSMNGFGIRAEDISFDVSPSYAQISTTHIRTNSCDSEITVGGVDTAVVYEDGNALHRYSAPKTDKNIQQLYKTEGVGGTEHVASYDIKFEKIYLNQSITSARVITAFRGFDDSGSGSGKDYSPYIEAVKAIPNGTEPAVLSTVNGDAIAYDKWYTFYMVSRIDGDMRYSSLYFKERGSSQAVRYVNRSSDAYLRDGVLSYVYVYVLSTNFSSDASSVFYVDNVSYRRQEIVLENESSVSDTYGAGATLNTDVYIAPGFENAKAHIDGQSADIVPLANDTYRISASLSGLDAGNHSFMITAVYGEGDAQNTVSFQKDFKIEKLGAISTSHMFKDGVSYRGEDVSFFAVPAGCEQTAENGAVKLALSDTASSGTEYIKIPFYSSGTSFYNAASTGKSHIISFDMKLGGVVAKSESETDFMQIRGLKNGAWTGGTYKLTICRQGDTTIIKGLGSTRTIDQNKWYTYSFVTNPDNSTYNVYCKEKGSDNTELIGTVSDADVKYLNCITLGVQKGSCNIQTGNDLQPRIAPDIYIDNLYIRQTLKTDGRCISDKVYTTSDRFETDVFVAPGFDSAVVSFDNETVMLTDNGIGVYKISNLLSSYRAPLKIDFKITADYGGNIVSAQETVNIEAKTKFTLHKDADGNEMFYPLDDAQSTDGAFPCMTVEKSVASYSLDTGKGDRGKSLKATYTVGNESAFCNFGYLGGDASDIGDNRFTKISMDVKFSTREFKVKVQNKFGGAWLSSGSSKELINKYGIVQTANSFYYDIDRWYNLAYVIDTANSEGKIYIDGEYICTNELVLSESQNPTQLQFCISHKSATADNPAYLWVDNLKIETSPYRFVGIAGDELEPVSAQTLQLDIAPLSNPGSGYSVSAEFCDGMSAGRVSVDSESGRAILNADGSFDPYRDITFKITDMMNGELLAQKTYTFVRNDGAILTDVKIQKSDDGTKASLMAKAGADTKSIRLVIAGYSDSGVKKLTGINSRLVYLTDSQAEYDVSLTDESANEFSAFVWGTDTVIPLKRAFSFNPTQTDSGSEGEYIGLYPEAPIKPIKGHPRLLFTQSDIPTILKNIQHPDMSEVYAKEEAAADEVTDGRLNTEKINNYDNHILSCIINRALFYALGLRDASHGRAAVDAMKNYFATVNYNPATADITRDMGNTMMAGAAVYDWCYDLLTYADKQEFIKHFKDTAAMKEVGYPPNKKISIAGHAGEGEIFGHLLSAGIAVYDEDKEIYEVSAGRMFSEFLDIRKMWNKTGAHPIGHTYAATRYDWELIANLLFIRMGYKDGILGEFDDLARVAQKFMYARLPMGYMMKLGDDWMWMRSENMSWFWTTYPGTTYNLAAVQTGNPYLKQAGAIQNYIAGYPISYNTLIPSILLIDPEAEGKFADTLPLANKTDYPLSSVQARTNWTMGIDSDAAVAHFEAREKMIMDHQHADLGSFQLYYKGYLAINAGTYAGTSGGWGSSHWYNYYSRTIAHNCMTIYDPDEEYYTDYHSKTGDKLSNDGGQINTQLVSTYEEFLSNPDEAKTEAWYIGPNKQTPEYSFVKTNLTNSYGNNKVKNHERSMVFMDLDNADYPAAVVIFDDVDASNANFRKAWIMNTQLEPSVSGNTSTVVRNDNGNNGKLVNKTLLPISPKVTTVGGEGKESWVDGVNYESKDKFPGQYSEQGMWRIEVSPSSKNERDYFLNSMYVTDYDRNLPELAMYKEETSLLWGVTVMDRAVYFPKNDRVYPKLQIDIRQNGYETVKCLITDIESGLWKVTDASGGFKVYRVSDDENTLYFRAAPGTVIIEKMTSGEADIIEYAQMDKPRYGDFLVYDTVAKMFYPLKNPTVTTDGARLVPAREFFEHNGFEVTQNGNKMTVSFNNIIYSFQTDSKVMEVNGKDAAMTTSPACINDIIYINPSDFAMFDTEYDSQARILGVEFLHKS